MRLWQPTHSLAMDQKRTLQEEWRDGSGRRSIEDDLRIHVRSVCGVNHHFLEDDASYYPCLLFSSQQISHIINFFDTRGDVNKIACFFLADCPTTKKQTQLHMRTKNETIPFLFLLSLLHLPPNPNLEIIQLTVIKNIKLGNQLSYDSFHSIASKEPPRTSSIAISP